MSPIKYLSVAQTAQKWDLSKRQVQRLLAHNRIDGAIKPGRDWLIPVDTIRPEDMRRRDAVQYRELNIEQMREVDELVISYLRGDFAAVIDFYRRHKDGVVLSLSISFITLPSAIATGDFALLTRIEAFLKDVIAADISQKATIVAELALSGVYVSAFTPDLIPDWLKTGDFSVVPAEFMLDAAFKRAKYYQCLGRFESTLSIAQTALSLTPDDPSIAITRMYTRLLIAVALKNLGREDEAARWIVDVMRDYLPLGYITPLADNVYFLDGMVERELAKDYPELYSTVLEQCRMTTTHWIAFHNSYTLDHITAILTPREYQMASLAVQGATNTEIAQQFGISVGRVKAILHGIYGKLHIHSRKELAAYIL